MTVIDHAPLHPVNPERQQAILTLALLAAFADGANVEQEREQIRRLAVSLGDERGVAYPAAIHQKMQTRYLPQIRQKAVGLDATRIMAMVRAA